MVRVCRLSHSLGSTLAPMAADPSRFPDCCGDGIGGGGREKTMRLRRTAKPLIEVRIIPAEERRRTSRAGLATTDSTLVRMSYKVFRNRSGC